MARVLTNNVILQYGVETALGVAPIDNSWRALEPNNLSAYGATITTVERRPISADRGRKKGTVTNLESAVEFDGDLTVDAFTDFAEGFVFAEFANKEFDLKSGSGLLPPPAVATTDDFTVDTISTLLGGKLVFADSGITEIRSRNDRSVELDVVELGLLEVRPCQDRAAHVCASQIDFHEMRAAQIRS